MNAPAPQLDVIQRWMQSVITHPRGVEHGIDSPEARAEIDVSPRDVDRVVSPSRALTSTQRLEIYGNAYYARLMECLGEVYPVLKQALGEEVFNEFAYGYLQQYPSQSYTLNHLGQHFARYLDESRPDREGGTEPPSVGWPDLLIDLARMEWAIGEVFDGPGVEKVELLSPSRLESVPPDRWPTARLVPVVCLRLLAFEFPVNDYYSALRRQESPSPPAPATTWLALTRRNYVVCRYPLTEPQYELLSALARGLPVGESIAHAASRIDEEMTDEQLASLLRDWFNQWSSEQLFAQIDVG